MLFRYPAISEILLFTDSQQKPPGRLDQNKINQNYQAGMDRQFHDTAECEPDLAEERMNKMVPIE